jgi:O-antigen ligase
MVARETLSRLLSIAIPIALLALIGFSAVPYGTAEFWWKGFIVCGVFAVTILWLLEGYLSGSWSTGGEKLFLPILALVIFAALQSFPLSTSNAWKAISVDPFSTRFFALQLLALTLAGAMLFRYFPSETGIKALVYVVLGIVVISALFGIVRQTMQHELGFGLPLIKPDQGYGQFINRGHFAFLMEMGFGLALGLVLGRGARRERALIYLAVLLPIWTALVLSNSRGGLLAMLVQVIGAFLLFGFTAKLAGHASGPFTFLRSSSARVVLLLALVGAVVVGTFWLGGDRLANRIETSSEFDTNVEQRVNSRRNQIWVATWHMFAAHPITGVGLGAYWAALPTFHDASGTVTPEEAHNDYLELLASGGVVGFALGAWFLVLLFRRVSHNLKITKGFRAAACSGALIGIIGVAVHSLVDFGLHMLVNALVFTALIFLASATPFDTLVDTRD